MTHKREKIDSHSNLILTSGRVVNESLRVHGVKNLRVVDASVFPLIPRGNVITSVYAVTERAVDLIKED